MANRLLRYELALFGRSFADAFATLRDKLLLALAGSLAILGLIAAAREWEAAPLPEGALFTPAAAILVSAAWQRRVAERLRWLAEQSPLAADALAAGKRRQYLLAAHAICLLSLLLMTGVLAVAAASAVPLIVAVTAYAAGLPLARIQAPVARLGGLSAGTNDEAQAVGGLRAVLRIVLRRQLLGSRRPERDALLLLAAVALATCATAMLGQGLPALTAGAAIAVPSLALLILASRQDADLLRFLPAAGYGPAAVAGAVSALPAALLLAAAAAIAIARPTHAASILALLVLVHAIAIVAGVARAWLLPGRTARAATMQLQVEIVGLALIASMVPPLAPAALVLRMAMLRRRHASFRWKQL